jgi:hypothetical protein
MSVSAADISVPAAVRKFKYYFIQIPDTIILPDTILIVSSKLTDTVHNPDTIRVNYALFGIDTNMHPDIIPHFTSLYSSNAMLFGSSR